MFICRRGELERKNKSYFRTGLKPFKIFCITGYPSIRIFGNSNIWVPDILFFPIFKRINYSFLFNWISKYPDNLFRYSEQQSNFHYIWNSYQRTRIPDFRISGYLNSGYTELGYPDSRFRHPVQSNLVRKVLTHCKKKIKTIRKSTIL